MYEAKNTLKIKNAYLRHSYSIMIETHKDIKED